MTIISAIIMIFVSTVLGISVISYSVNRLVGNEAKLSSIELLVILLMVVGSMATIIVDVVLAINIISILTRR